MHTESTAEETDGTRIWHWAVLVLGPATSAVAVWMLWLEAGEGPLTALQWAQGIFTIVAPLAVIALWLWVRPRVAERPAAHLPLMILMTVTLGVSTWTQPGLAGAMSFIMPLAWLATPTNRAAIIWSGVLVAAAGTGMMASGFTSPGYAIFTVIFSVGLSAAIGLSISKLHEQVLEREQLVRELQQKQDEIVALGSERAAEAERAAVLRDVHDAVTQNLTAIVMQSRLPNHDPALIEELASEALEETRALLLKATPSQLDSGLPAALQRLADRFEREASVTVTTRIEPLRLGLEPEIVLLRVCQELLANVRKHAQASSVEVTLEAAGGSVSLAVVDDGRGIDEARTASTADARGLRGIHERVQAVGGTVEVASSGGTAVTVRLPAETSAQEARA